MGNTVNGAQAVINAANDLVSLMGKLPHGEAIENEDEIIAALTMAANTAQELFPERLNPFQHIQWVKSEATLKSSYDIMKFLKAQGRAFAVMWRLSPEEFVKVMVDINFGAEMNGYTLSYLAPQRT